jgi:glycosyltransferase involved in cell wall biosynthesis
VKILIFNTLYYPNQIGGAEKSVQLLAEGLAKQGLEVVVITTSDTDYCNVINGVKVYYLKTTNLYWAYYAKEQKSYKKPLWHLIDSYNPFNKKIKKIIEEEKPNVVHTNNLAGFSVSVWKLAKEKNIKIVHTLRDYYLLCPKSTMFKNEKNCDIQCTTCKLYSIPKKLMSEYIDVLVGISGFILKRHINFGYFKAARHLVIYNSIKTHNNIEKKLHEELIFGYVGSLAPSKGIEMLLKVFSKKNIENSKLFVYGKGITKAYEKELKDKYENSKILFKGFQKPESIYTSIDVLIVPSLWNEPFGRIVPEANNYKVPVLVSNKGGLPELVENRKNGYIFDPDIDGDFEKKLDLLIQMYRKNQFEFDLNQFNFNDIINRYLDVYSQHD